MDLGRMSLISRACRGLCAADLRNALMLTARAARTPHFYSAKSRRQGHPNHRPAQTQEHILGACICGNGADLPQAAPGSRARIV
jgi:hypothetical protein